MVYLENGANVDMKVVQVMKIFYHCYQVTLDNRSRLGFHNYNICSHHGKCNCDPNDPIGIAVCQCDEGYSGRNCENRVENTMDLAVESTEIVAIVDGIGDIDSDDDPSNDDEIYIDDCDEDVKCVARRANLCPRVRLDLKCGE